MVDAQELARRHARVRERMEAEGFDALIVYSNAKVKGPVRYLSNYFTRFVGAQNQADGSYQWFGSCAMLFPLEGEPVLFTDQPWDEERAKEISDFGDTRYAENFGVEFAKLIKAGGYKSVGIDNWFIYPAIHYLPLTTETPDTKYRGTMLIEDVYRVKSEVEIEIMRQAEVVAMKAIEAGFAAVQVGATEYDFALAAEHAMRKHGELELAGSSIVSGGPNTGTGSSLPMHEGAYVMKSGDWALFDICPSWGGYAGDIARMIVAGSIEDLDPELKRMYDTTLAMNRAVIEGIKPGVTMKSLNALALEIATEAGFGENKIGLLGHSLGLDMHDPPDYYWDDSPLEKNMCITVEPCLLIPGKGGSRIEDVVVVTDDGCEVLSADCSKELIDSETLASR